MNRFTSLMAGQAVLPIVQAETVAQGIQAAAAMKAAGVKALEVVLRETLSLEVLTEIKTQFPELKVGAGTVLTTSILQQALQAGADFIITPACTPTLLTALVDCPVAVIPGVATPSEIALVREKGFLEIKLFPAAIAGGIPFLTAISSVFRDVSFCPTGGVNASNFRDYLALPNVMAVGGTWLAPKEWVQAEQWQRITQACELALAQ